MNRKAWSLAIFLFLLSSHSDILRILLGGSIINYGFWIGVDFLWSILFIRACIWLLKREAEKPNKADWVEKAYKFFLE